MEQSKFELLESLGFIYKRLSKHWFLVRWYADKRRLRYHIIFPAYFKDKDFERPVVKMSHQLSEEEVEKLNAGLPTF